MNTLPVTVIIAAKDEEANLPKCLQSLAAARKVFLVDSQSSDSTTDIAGEHGAEVIPFHYGGGYPKKRQWALGNLKIPTEWVLLLDADEVVPGALWEEIAAEINAPERKDAYLITKGFHFLGRRFKHGGFSHAAVLLFKKGTARFERLVDDASDGLDIEVHERLIVSGEVGRMNTPLVHEDFKNLAAYIDRHNRYSTWEAGARDLYLSKDRQETSTIRSRLWGDLQERRRFLKMAAIRIPFEPLLWFCYHYILRLGVLEGRRGYIASSLRAQYVMQARAKLYEIRLRRAGGHRRTRR
jgi:glycosyltransferase involved in cell wall biosynthesis